DLRRRLIEPPLLKRGSDGEHGKEDRDREDDPLVTAEDTEVIAERQRLSLPIMLSTPCPRRPRLSPLELSLSVAAERSSIHPLGRLLQRLPIGPYVRASSLVEPQRGGAALAECTQPPALLR